MSFKRKIGKHTVIHSCNWILLNNKKDELIYAWVVVGRILEGLADFCPCVYTLCGDWMWWNNTHVIKLYSEREIIMYEYDLIKWVLQKKGIFSSWLQDKKTERHTPADLEESKHPYCELIIKSCGKELQLTYMSWEGFPVNSCIKMETSDLQPQQNEF